MNVTTKKSQTSLLSTKNFHVVSHIRLTYFSGVCIKTGTEEAVRPTSLLYTATLGVPEKKITHTHTLLMISKSRPLTLPGL